MTIVVSLLNLFVALLLMDILEAVERFSTVFIILRLTYIRNSSV